MALALSGTSNGSLNNLSLSGNTATIVDTGKAGTIVQVVQATTATEVTVSTTTYTDTGLSASITPTSSSNKILVMVCQYLNSTRTVNDNGFGVKILRDSTVIFTPTENTTGPLSAYVDNSRNLICYHSIQYLDNPATTSSITYKTQGRPYTTADSGSVTFNWDGGTTTGNPCSVINLMEIVA